MSEIPNYQYQERKDSKPPQKDNWQLDWLRYTIMPGYKYPNGWSDYLKEFTNKWKSKPSTRSKTEKTTD